MLLKNPTWLFLDEATSALVPENKIRMYSLLQSELPQTTVISIAHDSELGFFHPLTLQFEVTADHHVHIRELEEERNLSALQ